MNNHIQNMAFIENAIDTLNRLSDSFEKIASRQDVYNTDWAICLDMMSHDFYKYANELKNRKDTMGGF